MIGAVPPERAHQLKQEWRSIRRGWLVDLSRLRTIPADAIDMLSDDERNFIATVRGTPLFPYP